MPDLNPKPAPKVMDIVHPGATQPTATSRPILPPSRPYMKTDPMLNAAESKGEDVSIPAPESAMPTSPDLSVAEPRIEPVEVASPPSLKDAPKKAESNSLEPATLASAEDQTAESVLSPEEPRQESKPEVAMGKLATDEVTAEPEVESDAADTEDDSTDIALQHQLPISAEEKVLVAREEELERLIAAGTYTVPIGAVKRKRQIVVTVLVSVLLVLIVAVDVLADMNVINLPAYIPHTNFISG